MVHWRRKDGSVSYEENILCAYYIDMIPYPVALSLRSASAILAMRTLIHRVSHHRLPNYIIANTTGNLHRRWYNRSMALNSEGISEGKSQTRLHLPGLPAPPRYPCPFVTAKDIETYILPLYRIGWGISCVPVNTSSEKRIPSATQLSKKIILPNPDITRSFVKDIMHLIEQENVKMSLVKRIGLTTDTTTASPRFGPTRSRCSVRRRHSHSYPYCTCPTWASKC